MIRGLLKRQIPITGFDPWVLYRNLKGAPAYFSDWRRYRQLNSSPTFRARLRYAYPILTDRYASAGLADGHYFHQDLWAARMILQHRPEEHLDIGSRVDGFVAHLLAFMPVTVVDIRLLVSNIILGRFSGLQLASFSYVGDDGALYQDTTPSLMPKSNFACGLFEFTQVTE